jgi:hypothetical protein
LISVSLEMDEKFIAPLDHISVALASYLENKCDWPDMVKLETISKVEKSLQKFPLRTHFTMTVPLREGGRESLGSGSGHRVVTRKMYVMNVFSGYLHSSYLWDLLKSMTPTLYLQCWSIEFKT